MACLLFYLYIWGCLYRGLTEGSAAHSQYEKCYTHRPGLSGWRKKEKEEIITRIPIWLFSACLHGNDKPLSVMMECIPSNLEPRWISPPLDYFVNLSVITALKVISMLLGKFLSQQMFELSAKVPNLSWKVSAFKFFLSAVQRRLINLFKLSIVKFTSPHSC